MFIMDVPYVPAQETPIVLAQASAPVVTPQPDYILNKCKETESTGDPSSAMRTVDPAYMLKNFLYTYSKGKQIADLVAIKTTLLQDTSHGKITSVVDNTGRSWYAYDPTPNYVGNDKAVFQAEFEGKVYKIVLELRVFLMVNEYEPTCPPPKLIKVKKPSTGSSGYDLFKNGVSKNGVSLSYPAFYGRFN